jgi:hypothetical protein
VKVIIAGSRHFAQERVFNGLDVWTGLLDEPVSEVVSGNSGGVDLGGEAWAKARNIPIRRFPADWRGLGRKAGPLRNEEMAKYADALLAIYDGESRGTADMIRRAKQHGLETVVLTVGKAEESNVE